MNCLLRPRGKLLCASSDDLQMVCLCFGALGKIMGGGAYFLRAAVEGICRDINLADCLLDRFHSAVIIFPQHFIMDREIVGDAVSQLALAEPVQRRA